MPNRDLDQGTKAQLSTDSNPWPKTDEQLTQQLAECPDEIRRKVMAEAADLRAHPKEVLGRDDQLDEIETKLIAVAKGPKRNLEESGIKGQAIVGPPGAGKTTMLNELKQRLRKRKVNIVELMAQHLRSPEKFSTQIKQQPPWRGTDRWDQLAKAATTGTAKALDEVLSTLATGGLNHLVKIAKILKDVEVEDIRPVTDALEAWRDGRTPGTEDVLRLLQNVNPHGTIITIDEAQELTTFLGQDRESQREHPTSDVLRMLNDPGARATQRIWNVTLLIAGMQDTPKVVEGLTTITPDTHELGAVPPTAVRTMIENGIDRSNASATDRKRAKAQWVSALAAEYGDWTRHARCAEEAARIVLAIAGSDALNQPWGTALITKKANTEREKLYQEIVNRSKDNDVDTELQTTVMLGLQGNDHRLSGKELNRLVRHWLVQGENQNGDGPKPTDEPVQKDAKAKINSMTRSGLIAMRKGMHESPIPSLMGYIIHEYDGHHRAARQALASAGLEQGDPGKK